LPAEVANSLVAWTAIHELDPCKPPPLPSSALLFIRKAE